MNARFLQKRTREKCRREFVSLLKSLFFKHQKSWQAKNARTNLWACNFSSRPLKLIRNGVPKNISPAAAGAALLKAQNWWRDDIFLTPVTVLHKNIIWLYTVKDRLHQAHLLKSPAFSVCFKKLAPFFWNAQKTKIIHVKVMSAASISSRQKIKCLTIFFTNIESFQI